MHPLRPGDPEKLGAYVISGRLADGPRGAAFLGRESDDAPLRVIKLLPPEPEAGDDDVARLTAVQRVSSAYVARTLEAGKHGDHRYVVREHVEGRSLAQVVAEDGPLDGDALERVAVGVLTALTAVHLAGITHRGLSPYNVIMGPDGPRVTDIDLGEPAGEVGYRAPEQIRGLAYGPYADVFGWAATVVFAATGQPPFGQDLDAVLNAQPEVGDLGEPLRRVALSALSKDVAQRPTTYMALLQLLGDKRGGATGALGAAGVVKGNPAEEAPLQGVPVPGVPPEAGQVPVAPQQTWGPPEQAGPVPPHGGPIPAQGGYPGGPVPGQGALRGGPEPMQGVPMPPGGPAWGPPQEPARPAAMAGQTVSSRPPRKFPAGLAAAVGALALLSGVGLWGANQYASTQRFEPVAAAGDQAERNGSGSEKVENGVAQAEQNPPAQGQPQQGQPEQGQAEVVVPWASPTGGDPNEVGPMVLPNDWATQSPPAPELTTVPTPAPIPTQPVAQPTPAQPTVTVTATPEATPTPSPSPTDMVHPSASPTVTVTATPTPTVTVTETPTPTPTETPVPTVTVTETPTAPPEEKPTATAKPTAKPTATAKPTVKPTATKTAKPPATNPYSAVKVCGSGFYVQRQQSFPGGETFQLYSKDSGENCVVTLKRVNLGKATEVSATLAVQDGDSKTDRGKYEYYAGPVKTVAKGKCVRFAGSVGEEGVRADWANCG